MVANPERDARLENACRVLFERYGYRFTVKQLTKEAKVSATVATPWRKAWLAKQHQTGASCEDDVANSVSGSVASPERAELMLSSLLKLTMSSQEQVASLLNMVNMLLSHFSKAPSTTPFIKSELAPNIVPTTMDMAVSAGRDDQIDGEPAPIDQASLSSPTRNPELFAERPMVATKLKKLSVRDDVGQAMSPHQSGRLDDPKVAPSQLVFEFNLADPRAAATEAKGKTTSQERVAESRSKSSRSLKAVARLWHKKTPYGPLQIMGNGREF
jgi:hypothetical protein